LAFCILAAVASGVVETEPLVVRGRERWFAAAELGFAYLFAVEYVARLWTAAEGDSSAPWRARLRWLVSPWAILDLLAFVPALIAPVGPTYVLRIVRFARILRLAKLGRFSQAWRFLAEAIAGRRYELLLTFAAGVFVLITSATLLYLVEGPGQPDKFGSIPRSLWWSVVTLTTIGYGDVYPLTAAGKALTAATAVIGVGLIATPAGILAAAFSDGLQRQRNLRAPDSVEAEAEQ
jgi:voltage-gated potassium channel